MGITIKETLGVFPVNQPRGRRVERLGVIGRTAAPVRRAPHTFTGQPQHRNGEVSINGLGEAVLIVEDIGE